MTSLSPKSLLALAADLREEMVGDVLLASEQPAEYEAARKVWNGMVDKKPALIARPLGAGACA